MADDKSQPQFPQAAVFIGHQAPVLFTPGAVTRQSLSESQLWSNGIRSVIKALSRDLPSVHALPESFPYLEKGFSGTL